MSRINIIKNFISTEDLTVLNQYVRSSEIPWADTGDAWTGRFIHSVQIPNSTVKELVEKVATATTSQIEKTTGKTIRVETCQLVRWRIGDQLDPPHADGEHLDGTLHPYAQRHYSALVYLNNDFEGGRIFFPNENLAPEIEPGMLVHFTGTKEDLHGVTKVTSGMRYTMVMFFTRVE